VGKISSCVSTITPVLLSHQNKKTKTKTFKQQTNKQSQNNKRTKPVFALEEREHPCLNELSKAEEYLYKSFYQKY
jgi:transposase